MHDSRRPIDSSSRTPDSHLTHPTTRKGGTSIDTNNQNPDLQGLNERSARIIAVMGPTGAGKSTFIKKVTGAEDVRVGHTLRSCTEEVRAVRCRHPSKDEDIVLVDTPGFDDTFKSDAQILEQIATWLKDTYQAGAKLSGILYLHRITDNRMTNTIRRNFDVFRVLCGSDVLSSIILVTTHWDLLHANNIHEGMAREEELCKQYWKTLLSSGSKMLRFENTYSSAWNIIDSLPGTTISLKIQQEMVDEGKGFHDTAAAQSLSSWHQWAGQVFPNMIQRLELLLKGVADSSSQNHAETKRLEEDLRQAGEGLKVIRRQEERFSRSRSIASSVSRKLRRSKKNALPD